MKLLFTAAAICFLIGTTNSLTYPIFGTKRYNRGGISQASEMTEHILKQPVYENGYLTNNGYYYYPHHEYHSYGMPTYRGEYKPKAYYYASGPSYNYYNDREPVSNPLDDLHEEILQENEQERQSDFLQGDDYEYDYYIDPNEKVHDPETTSNFLRNMKEYNRQNEKQQRLQLHYRQRDQFDQETHNKDDDYFSEIGVNPDDYQYEPQGEDNFDVEKFWNVELPSLNKGVTSTDQHHRRELKDKLNNVQDVEDLRSLSKQEPESYDEDYKKRYLNKVKQLHLNSVSHTKLPDSSLTPKQKEFEDDYSPVDYDDGSWINWDRKRSALPNKNHVFNINKLKPQIKSHKHVLSTTQNKRNIFKNESPESTSMRSTGLSSIARGQKEKYPMQEIDDTNISNQKNEEKIKNSIAIQKNFYETIKRMITIEQELKKNGSKMQPRNTSDGGSVVKQLDSLKKH